MDNSPTDDPTPEPAGTRQAIEHLRSSLEKGGDWPTALVEAVGLWTAPSETYEGREYTYFLDGEAFDWLVLAERLCQAAQDLVPGWRDREPAVHRSAPRPL